MRHIPLRGGTASPRHVAARVSIVIASAALQSSRVRSSAVWIATAQAPRNDGQGFAKRLELGQGDPFLPHIFAGTVGIACLTRLLAFQEEELTRPFMRLSTSAVWFAKNAFIDRLFRLCC